MFCLHSSYQQKQQQQQNFFSYEIKIKVKSVSERETLGWKMKLILYHLYKEKLRLFFSYNSLCFVVYANRIVSFFIGISRKQQTNVRKERKVIFLFNVEHHMETDYKHNN